MKLLVLVAALLASPSVPVPAGTVPTTPTTEFRLIVESHDNRWALACERGCDWQAATFACADACSVMVDKAGISAANVRRMPATGFAFTLSRSERGWAAATLQGTAWTEVSWGCGRLRSCTARLDENGVGPR